MSIKLTCECGKRLSVPSEHAGKRGQCPACGSMISIPKATDLQLQETQTSAELTPQQISRMSVADIDDHIAQSYVVESTQKEFYSRALKSLGRYFSPKGSMSLKQYRETMTALVAMMFISLWLADSSAIIPVLRVILFFIPWLILIPWLFLFSTAKRLRDLDCTGSA